MAPQTAAAAPRQAQPASTIQHVKRRVSEHLLARESARAAADLEQQAWDEYVNGLPTGTLPRFCKDCAKVQFKDEQCSAITVEINPVHGPRFARCSDARRSDGTCGFTATLFVHGSANLAANVTDLDADLHPLDSELVLEIRAMFLAHWNMDSIQADARMAHFNYGQAVAALPAPVPGAIGSAFGADIYAGIIRGSDGAPDEHLVLLDGEAEAVTWDAAVAWAAAKGASLPTRAEQRLLMANLPDQFKPEWYWSGTQAGPSYAWGQYFGGGSQGYDYRSSEGRARAVRRFPI